jgi:hypothetical protein
LGTIARSGECQSYIKKKGYFGFTKSTLDFHLVGISHGWIFPEDSLSKINMSYAEIMEQNPRYTSELKKEDWPTKKTKRNFFYLGPTIIVLEGALSLIKSLRCMK